MDELISVIMIAYAAMVYGPRAKDAELRTREHFTPTRSRRWSKGNRYGHRDATMILLTAWRGLRATEVCEFRWERVDFNGAPRCRSCSSASVAPRLRRQAWPRMIERAAAAAGLELKAHPHMLRHACGHALADKGTTPGARPPSITSTGVNTALAPNRFRGFWQE
jgi:integrase